MPPTRIGHRANVLKANVLDHIMQLVYSDQQWAAIKSKDAVDRTRTSWIQNKALGSKLSSIIEARGEKEGCWFCWRRWKSSVRVRSSATFLTMPSQLSTRGLEDHPDRKSLYKIFDIFDTDGEYQWISHVQAVHELKKFSHGRTTSAP